MCRHWPIVTFVAETLVKNAAGLDKDGIDLMFTVDGETLNIPKIKGESGRQSLQRALRKSITPKSITQVVARGCKERRYNGGHGAGPHRHLQKLEE
jgi:hypothetical protein